MFWIFFIVVINSGFCIRYIIGFYFFFSVFVYFDFEINIEGFVCVILVLKLKKVFDRI